MHNAKCTMQNAQLHTYMHKCKHGNAKTEMQMPDATIPFGATVDVAHYFVVGVVVVGCGCRCCLAMQTFKTCQLPSANACRAPSLCRCKCLRSFLLAWMSVWMYCCAINTSQNTEFQTYQVIDDASPVFHDFVSCSPSSELHLQFQHRLHGMCLVWFGLKPGKKSGHR